MPTMIFSKIANRTGNAKATGNPYSINTAEVLTVFQPQESASSKLTGAGLESVEVEIGENCYHQVLDLFKGRFKGMPVPLDVETGLSRSGKVIVIGVKP